MVKEIDGKGLDPKRIRNIAAELMEAFDWDTTDCESGAYWNTVYDNLYAVAREVEEQQKPCPTCGQERK